MRSSSVGASTLAVEVLQVSPNGLCLYVKGKEHFLPCAEFPWFQDACLSDVHRMRLLHGRHLRWEALDVDLDLESFEHPDRYPLKYR